MIRGGVDRGAPNEPAWRAISINKTVSSVRAFSRSAPFEILRVTACGGKVTVTRTPDVSS